MRHPMAMKRKYVRKQRSKPKTPEQERNAAIFRLRGYYANAKTLPFNDNELGNILGCIDNALARLNAEIQSTYMTRTNRIP